LIGSATQKQQQQEIEARQERKITSSHSTAARRSI